MKPVIGLLSGREIKDADIIEMVEGGFEPSGLMASPVEEDLFLEDVVIQMIQMSMEEANIPEEQQDKVLEKIMEFAVADRIHDRHLEHMLTIMRNVARESSESKTSEGRST